MEVIATMRSTRPESAHRWMILLICLCVGCAKDSSTPTESVEPESPRTLTVRSDGSGDAATIQAAIDSCRDGDTIELADGTFSGAGNRNITFEGKAIELRSASGNPAACIVRPGDHPVHGYRGFIFESGEGPETVVEGITIIDAHGMGIAWDGNGAGGARLPIMTYGGAILCRHGSSPTIRNCVFARNWAGETGGIYCIEKSSPLIVGCTFFWNGGGWGAAIGGWDASPTIESTIIAFNREGYGVYCHGDPGPALNCCNLFGNASGDWEGEIADQLDQGGNISQDPQFADAENNDLHLVDDSPCLPDSAGCGLIGALGIGE